MAREGQAVTPAELSLALLGDARKSATAWVWAARDVIKRAAADSAFHGLRLESLNLHGGLLTSGEKLAAYRLVRGEAVCYRKAAHVATRAVRSKPVGVAVQPSPDPQEATDVDFGLFALRPLAEGGSAQVVGRDITLNGDEVEFLTILREADGRACPLSDFRWPSDQLRKLVNGLCEKLDADVPFLSRVFEPAIVTPRGFRLARQRLVQADRGYGAGGVCLMNAAGPG
jgi:hypothetical protein